MVIWFPVFATMILGPALLGGLLQPLLLGLTAVGYGVCWALISPECGLAERLTGTCLVPE
jgi:hypothetical protein